jgi:hypothetical protein
VQSIPNATNNEQLRSARTTFNNKSASVEQELFEEHLFKFLSVLRNKLDKVIQPYLYGIVIGLVLMCSVLICTICCMKKSYSKKKDKFYSTKYSPIHTDVLKTSELELSIQPISFTTFDPPPLTQSDPITTRVLINEACPTPPDFIEPSVSEQIPSTSNFTDEIIAALSKLKKTK